MSPDQPRVLLVDDNELNLFLLMDMLQELDLVPIIAESGTEALEFASRHEFAVILLDTDMPGMDGFQVLNKLASKSETSEIPVIFMSPNLSDRSSIEQGNTLAPVDIIHKPINKQLLLERVSYYLQLDKQYRAISNYFRDKIRSEKPQPEGLLALDGEGKIVFANPAAVTLLRTRTSNLLGVYFETLLERSHHEVVSNWKNSVLAQACRNKQTTKVEHTILWCGDGHKLVVSFIAYPLLERFRLASSVDTLVVFHEIQDQQYSDERLSDLVNYDSLTRLINKDSFYEMGYVAMESMNPGDSLGLILWNLDHFDYINEGLGHEIGDELMKAIAQRLRNCIPASSSLARIGGDEFALSLPALHDKRAALTTAHALLTVFKASFLVGGHEIFVSASAGIAVSPEAGTSFDSLMRNADRALKKAKDEGRARVEVFNNAMALADKANFELSTDLHKVLSREELFLNFKPLIDLETGALDGLQALLYWRHPSQGVLDLDDFQLIAEESGLMPAIGEWAMLEACKNCQDWGLGNKPDRFRLRIKLSLYHILYKGFLSGLDDILAVTGMNPACLELEVSEANLNKDNLVAFIAIFKILNEKGIRIALDDFGSNYLNLASLEDVEFHSVKLGENFLKSTLATPSSDSILKSVIEIAHEYGSEVMAAELQQGEQLELLKKLGCDRAALQDAEWHADEVKEKIQQLT